VLKEKPKALQARDDLTGILLALIAERRKMPADAAPGNVLELIVHARDEVGRQLDDEQIRLSPTC
jgi:cytochrome P450